MSNLTDVQAEVARLRSALISTRWALDRIRGQNDMDRAVVREIDGDIERALFEIPTTQPLALIGHDRALLDRLGDDLQGATGHPTAARAQTRRGVTYEVEIVDPSDGPTGRVALVDVSLLRVEQNTTETPR